MAEEKKRKYCKDCEQKVLAVRPGTNHVLHLLLTICTAGLWLIIWVLVSAKIGGWKCPICGRSV
jgi:hypothetical protein